MRSPHATWRPVAYTGLHGRIKRRAVLLHTNGGGSDNGSLYGWWSAGARGAHGPDNVHVGAHFQVASSGHAEQYVDTDLVIYHAYDASEWAVAIETEDDGHPSTPWTDAAIATIIAICRDLQVPPHLLTSPSPGDGIGWHEMFPEWNKQGHDCPGSVREQQIRTLIVPSLAGTPPHLTVASENNDYAKLVWTSTPGATVYRVQQNGVFVADHTAGEHVTSKLHGRNEFRVLATGPNVHLWSNIAVVTAT